MTPRDLACTCCGRTIPPDAPSLGVQEDENGDPLGELVNCPECGSTVVRLLCVPEPYSYGRS